MSEAEAQQQEQQRNAASSNIGAGQPPQTDEDGFQRMARSDEEDPLPLVTTGDSAEDA